jgi:Ni/Co efflux regulator RcnB
MKLSHTLLMTVAVACLSWAPSVLAQPPSDQGKVDGGQGQQLRPGHGAPVGQQNKGGQQGGPAPQGQAQGGRATSGGPGGRGSSSAVAHAPAPTVSNVQTQQGQRRGGQFQNQGAATALAPTPAVRSAVRRAAPAAPTVQTQQGQRRGGQSQVQAGRTAVQRPAAPPLSGWNQALHGSERDQAGQQWRQGHSGWDSNALWRSNPNWWRGDSGFRLYTGAREGYFFIPELGYILVPQQYQRGYWAAGGYLPSWFWRYVVRDYGRYGLPQPPDGCVWVWVDGDVALIDASDGYILDIEHNLW